MICITTIDKTGLSKLSFLFNYRKIVFAYSFIHFDFSLPHSVTPTPDSTFIHLNSVTGAIDNAVDDNCLRIKHLSSSCFSLIASTRVVVVSSSSSLLLGWHYHYTVRLRVWNFSGTIRLRAMKHRSVSGKFSWTEMVLKRFGETERRQTTIQCRLFAWVIALMRGGTGAVAAIQTLVKTKNAKSVDEREKGKVEVAGGSKLVLPLSLH